MTIALKESTHVLCYFTVTDEETYDFFFVCYRDSPEDPWIVKGRRRLYADDKAHDSIDPKNWFTTTVPPEDDALDCMRTMFLINKAMFKHTASDFQVVDGTTDDFFACIESSPSFHKKEIQH